METPETEKSFSSTEESSQLNRNRSFKTKQLVRSRAIRESTSPPRTASPAAPRVNVDQDQKAAEVTEVPEEHASDTSSHATNVNDVTEDEKVKPVEIQITSGACDAGQRQRARRWLGHELLPTEPRVSCVCGPHCPHCRGNKRQNRCPTKQDSGISCSDDCPDCSDTEHSGGSNSDSLRKSESVELEQTEHSTFCRCSERKEKPKNISLSRTDSDDRQELSEAELVGFIKATLNKNSRDRMTILKIEKELHNLVNDTSRCVVRFPVMSSYGRLLVHRVASLFELAHHLDTMNKNAVLVSKSGTSGGRIPCTSFKQWCTVNFPSSPHHVSNHESMQAKSILKRDAQSLEEGGGAGAGCSAQRSKSLEQRERDYERVRRRIFSNDNCTVDESQWPWLSGPVKVLAPESGRNKLLKVQSLEGPQGTQGCRNRGPVSKSHSFGGYGPAPRLLSRQGDLASSSWRLSPSSSGYKTLSLRSTDSVTPSPTGGVSPEPGVPPTVPPAAPSLVWAVTDLASVPAGALIIHPQTGRPLTNPDGSVYRYDPTNPPLVYADPADQDKLELDQNNEKRRGRLEKQDSFIDTECECQPSEEYRSKACFCDCRRTDVTCHTRHTDQVQKQTEPEPEPPTPQTPTKTPHLPTQKEPPNHSQEAAIETSPFDGAANQMQAFDAPANQRQAHESSASQKQAYESSTNQRAEEAASERSMQYEVSNQKLPYEVTNQRPQYQPPTNQRSPPYESTNQSSPPYESTNQRSPPYEATIQRSPPYESTNHRLPSYDATANQRAEMKQSHEIEAYLQQSYVQYRSEQETISPHQIVHQGYMQDPTLMVKPVGSGTPVNLHDPNMRQMSLSGMVYPTQLAPGYTYTNQCRMETSLPPPMYQPVAPSGGDEPKQHHPQSPQAQEPTFRIDASYPYQPIDACATATGYAPHVGYNMGYGQLDAQRVMPTCQMLQPQHYTVPYPQIPWQNLQPILTTNLSNCATPVQKPTSPPNLYLPPPDLPLPYPYSYYPYSYPLMPQVVPYQICQPMYPVVERKNSTTPTQMGHESKVPSSMDNNARAFARQSSYHGDRCHGDERRTFVRSNSVRSDVSNSNSNSSELALKIQQIKDQMAALNTQERDRDRAHSREGKREEYKGRRNNGNGILGSYPAGNNGYNNNRVMGRPANDESQLSSAARAIVNSIRNMQAKNNVHTDHRRGQDSYPQPREHTQTTYHKHDHYQRHDSYQPRHRYQGRVPEKRQDNEEKEGNEPCEGGQPPQSTADRPERTDRPPPRPDPRHRPAHSAGPFPTRQPYLMRQMSPGTWCRRSPAPLPPSTNMPRRPPPDTRNQRRQ